MRCAYTSCWCWNGRMSLVAALITIVANGQPEVALQTNQVVETSSGGAKGEGADLPHTLRRQLMDDNYEYQQDDSDGDALPHQRPQRRYQEEHLVSPTSTLMADDAKGDTVNAEDRDSDFFPSVEQHAPPALSRSGMTFDGTATAFMPHSRRSRNIAEGRRAMNWRRVPLPGADGGATPSDASRGVREPLLPSRLPFEPEDSYWAVNHLGEGPANMFDGVGFEETSLDYDGRDAEVSRVNDMLRHQRDIDPGMRRFMQPDHVDVDNTNRTIRLIKVAGKARSGRRAMPRAIIQEEGAGGVVLVSLDGSPLPPFRLPADRRQYMHTDNRRHSHNRHRLPYHTHSGNDNML